MSAASLISSSDASGLPQAIFSAIVPANNSDFCKAIEIFSRKSTCLYSLTFTPSTNTSPLVTS